MSVGQVVDDRVEGTDGRPQFRDVGFASGQGSGLRRGAYHGSRVNEWDVGGLFNAGYGIEGVRAG